MICARFWFRKEYQAAVLDFWKINSDDINFFFLVSGPGIRNEIVDETSLNYIIHGNNKVSLGPREKYAPLKGVSACKTANLSQDVRSLYFLQMPLCNFMTLPGSPSLGIWETFVCYEPSQALTSLIDPMSPYPSFPPTVVITLCRRVIQERSTDVSWRMKLYSPSVLRYSSFHSQPLNNSITASDLDNDGKADFMTEYSIATRLAQEIHRRELPNYAKAASRCVHLNFDTNVYDLTEEQFKDRFYEGVVVPLKEDWEYVHK